MARVPSHPAIAQSFTRRPEWRMNPVTGEWVIMAPQRSARPMMPETIAAPEPSTEPCPFCAGNEAQTPNELLAYRSAGSTPNGPGWRVRTVPNSFAAVIQGGNPEPSSDGFFARVDGIGRHELFIECPHHESNLARLSLEQVREVVQMWRERLIDAGNDPYLRYAQLFKNHGGDAGASVEHAHSQLIATPMIPLTIQEEMRFASEYFAARRHVLLLRIDSPRTHGKHTAVSASQGCFAFTAYAGRQPFETWIVPTRHLSHLQMITTAGGR